MRGAAPTRPRPAFCRLGRLGLLGAVLVAGLGCGEAYGENDVLSGSHSHIPPIVRESARGAPVDPNEMLLLSVALPLRNEAELDATLKALYDPNDVQFGHYLTPNEFAARHHPTAADVAAVRATLAEHHLTAEARAHGCLLSVHGRAADVEETFATALFHFTSSDGTDFVAPTSEITPPGNLPLKAVHGLVSGLTPKTLYHAFEAPSRPGGSERARAFVASPNSITPAGMRAAYGVPAAARGAGQTIGLLQLDSFDPQDVAQFASEFGLPAPTITAIRLDGASEAVSNTSTQVEVQLDIMMAMAMAPAAEIRIYQGQSSAGSAGYQYYLNIFNEMANPTLGDRKLVRNLSTSYGYFEAQLSSANLQSEAAIFKQMAAQGQTLFGAAGDSGAYGQDSGGQQVVTVVDPAVQPFVVAVGGTRLAQAVGGGYGGETTWAAGGGGVSRLWPTPDYQADIAALAGIGSASLRNAPDIAMDADPNSGFQIVYQRRTVVVGGTSAAAPLWAGVQALINERRASRGLSPVGFFNPALYRVAARSPGAFNDIVTGNNGIYQALVGYDNVTGWGSPKVADLLDAMAAGYPRTPFVAPTWSFD